MESNDSPEIPDREGDIRHPRPPFGGTKQETAEKAHLSASSLRPCFDLEKDQSLTATV